MAASVKASLKVCLFIIEATDKFNADYVIGKGGFGLIYKGKLRHTLVAIKVLSEVRYISHTIHFCVCRPVLVASVEPVLQGQKLNEPAVNHFWLQKLLP